MKVMQSFSENRLVTNELSALILYAFFMYWHPSSGRYLDGDDDTNTKSGGNSTLDNDATLVDDATPFDNNTKLVARTLRRDAWQRHHDW